MNDMINWKTQYGKQGLKRDDFDKSLLIEPIDYGLATNVLDELNYKHKNIFHRFYQDGILHQQGGRCFFMSHLLRRIMKIHGIDAHVQQVVLDYKNPARGWKCKVGKEVDFAPKSFIDSHIVVTTPDFIFDFSQIQNMHHTFGVRAPIALIVQKEYDTWQDLGEFGKAHYTVRHNHPITRNFVLEQREEIIEATKQYFEKYKA